MMASKMPEVTRITTEELKRREKFLMEGLLPYDITNPYSWSVAGRMAIASFFVTCTWMSIYNVWFRRPWYAGFVPKMGLIGGAVTVAYFIGKMRAHNSATRDAVIDHYMEMHPDDFERTNDFNGRPYREIMMPWYPQRVQYLKMPLISDEFETPR